MNNVVVRISYFTNNKLALMTCDLSNHIETEADKRIIVSPCLHQSTCARNTTAITRVINNKLEYYTSFIFSIPNIKLKSRS